MDAPPQQARAAQYVRMSTEHQNYSIEHQMAALAEYARARDVEIVRTYSDSGISGLGLKRRKGLQQLLADVLGGNADFSLILTYDVSRWGRFQDPDQSAHYEFICKEAGVGIEYCAEPFDNDGSLTSTLVKHLKRAMAAEYSRELSVKVGAAQMRLAAKGYWQGGPPGYGLRRRLIDPNGVTGPILEEGQWKAVTSDRVVLATGPAEEVEVVRRIFRLFLVNGLSRASVARVLREEGLRAEYGAAWTGSRVKQVLTNEKYVGNQMYGKSTGYLRGLRTSRPRRDWLRAQNAVEPIVTRAVFDQTQRNIAKRFRRLSEADMLTGLASLLAEHGHLNSTLINDAELLPCAEQYRRRFGGLVGAYARIGYAPAPRAVRASEVNRRGSPCMRRNRPNILSPEEMIERLKKLLARTGQLSVHIINDAADLPSVEAYRRAFGDMMTVYALVGYSPTAKQENAARQMTAKFAAGALVKR